MSDEMDALPPQDLLAESGDFVVHLASAAQIPCTLSDIGRCRELTCREVGEGTGRACDLDAFDDYYQHIVLWHRRAGRVAGAYRVAATPDVLPTRGISGLYSSTLFHYQAAFFERIGPALELGRSFICHEYQKQYQPLLLLWKGILQYVQRRPECAVLFGAVSISSEYQPLSRTLIVDFLNGHLASQLSVAIRPRRGFRAKALVPKNVRRLSRLLPTFEELSSSVQDLEADGKGLPILIRQYLKSVVSCSASMWIQTFRMFWMFSSWPTCAPPPAPCWSVASGVPALPPFTPGISSPPAAKAEVSPT